MPPLSQGLRSATTTWRISRSITELDFLLPWAVPARHRVNLRCYSDHGNTKDGQDGSGHAVSASDVLEKHGESSKRPLESQPEMSPAPSRATAGRSRSPVRQRASLSEEVASLSSSLPELLEAWDEQPPANKLPGVDLPKRRTPSPSSTSSPDPSIDPGVMDAIHAANRAVRFLQRYEEHPRGRRKVRIGQGRQPPWPAWRTQSEPSDEVSRSSWKARLDDVTLTDVATTTVPPSGSSPREPSPKRNVQGLGRSRLPKPAPVPHHVQQWAEIKAGEEHILLDKVGTSDIYPSVARSNGSNSGEPSPENASMRLKAPVTAYVDQTFPHQSMFDYRSTGQMRLRRLQSKRRRRPLFLRGTLNWSDEAFEGYQSTPRKRHRSSVNLESQVSAMEEALDTTMAAAQADLNLARIELPEANDEVKEMTKRLVRIERQRSRREASGEHGLNPLERIRKQRLQRRKRPLHLFRSSDDADHTEPPTTAFVRRQLLRENPPSPRVILDNLGARPEWLSKQNLEVLLKYADRVGDRDTETQVKRAMSFIFLAGHTKTGYKGILKRRRSRRSFHNLLVRVVDRWQRKRNRNVPGRLVDPEDAVEYVKKELSRRRQDPKGTEYPNRSHSPFWFLYPHPWAEAMVPLKSRLPDHPTIDDRLGYLHYMLATADFRKETFPKGSSDQNATVNTETASSALMEAEAHDFTNPVKSTSASLVHNRDTWFSQPSYRSLFLESIYDIVQACHKAGKKQQGTRQAMLLVLYLYMIYASRIPELRALCSVPEGCSTILYKQLSQPYLNVWIFEEYARLFEQPRPSRETLHLLFQGILFGAPTFRSSAKWSDMPQPEVSHIGDFNYPYRFPPKPVAEESSQLISDVHTVLHTFQRRWRIYPGPETIRLLSSYALRVDNVDLAKECWDMWWSEMSRKVGREPRWEGDYPRWDHRQKHANSWIEILKSMKKQGWVEKSNVDQLGLQPITTTSRAKEAIFRRITELRGQPDSFKERRVLKRRLARAGAAEQQVSEIHPDIQRGTDGDGQTWYGFTDRPRRWKWVGREMLAYREGSIEVSTESAVSELKGQHVGLGLIISDSTQQVVGQEARA